MPVDISRDSQAERLAKRFHEAMRRIAEERGLLDAATPFDELHAPHRAVIVAAAREMLDLWVSWAPSGRGVGLEVEEKRRASPGEERDASRMIGGTDGEDDEREKRRAR